MPANDLGLIGLGVMGRNLVLNVERRGFAVAVFNRTADRTRELMAGLAREQIEGTFTLPDLVASLRRPRKVLLMVKAGPATDAVLDVLLPVLTPGDVVIDGGNAHFEDTDRRIVRAKDAGLLYLGVGISGGTFGALHGPSIMAGGSREAYAVVGTILEAIAARGPDGTCCAYLGPGSAGHYVKMVHNGIEYAIMQILAEAYDVMRRGLGMSALETADVFVGWNRKELSSYLVEITARILRRLDPESGRPLVEMILDTAAQKGTGKWSSQSALDIGAPAPTIAAAVFARIVSSLKEDRLEAEALLAGPAPTLRGNTEPIIADLFSATFVAIVDAYAEGMRQLRDASEERGYDLDLSEVARVWMDGCIIRAKLLVPMAGAFRDRPDLPYLLLAEPFRRIWSDHQSGLRRTVSRAHDLGIAVPALSSALNAIDAYRTGRLPANLLQAQRDYFGAHAYRRIDRDGLFHTDWESEAGSELSDF